MAKGNPSERLIRENERLRNKLDECRRHRTGTVVASVGRTFIRWVCGSVAVVYVARDLAGKITYLNAHVDAAVDVCKNLGDIIEEVAPSYLVEFSTGLGLAIAIFLLRRRNTLYRSLVTEHGKVTERYEKLVNPNRSSSGLAADGKTAEGDHV